MGRPAKLMSASSGKISKEERQRRIEKEKELQGKRDKLKPPAWLNVNQKKIFKAIIENAGHLGNIDVYLVQVLAIAIDRAREIEKLINANIELLKDADLRKAGQSYQRDIFTAAKLLCLFPNQRGKGNESGEVDPVKALSSILTDAD